MCVYAGQILSRPVQGRRWSTAPILALANQPSGLVFLARGCCYSSQLQRGRQRWPRLPPRLHGVARVRVHKQSKWYRKVRVCVCVWMCMCACAYMQARQAYAESAQAAVGRSPWRRHYAQLRQPARGSRRATRPKPIVRQALRWVLC